MALVVDGIGVLLMVALGLAIGEAVSGHDARSGWRSSPASRASRGSSGCNWGLAVGRMGVVAPVTGLLAASIPVAVGFVGAGLPGPES